MMLLHPSYVYRNCATPKKELIVAFCEKNYGDGVDVDLIRCSQSGLFQCFCIPDSLLRTVDLYSLQSFKDRVTFSGKNDKISIYATM